MNLKLLTLAAALLMASNASQAARFNFSQTGFEEGAIISGYFEVNDLNNDGQILAGDSLLGYNLNELSAFSLSFSGNSLVAAFTQSLSDITVFSYKLGTSFLGDDSSPIGEAIGTNWLTSTGYAYSGGIGSGYGWSQVETLGVDGALSISNEQMSVTAVPLPGAVWLFGSTLFGLAGLRKRG